MDIEALAEKLVRSQVRGLRPYRPGKPIEVLLKERGLARAVKLASNESPFPPPESVCRASAAASATLNRYPEGSGEKLRVAIASFHGVSPDEIILGSGSSEVLAMALRAFLNPGEEVLMPEPSFLIYPVLVREAGGEPVPVPLGAGFRYDLTSFAARVTPRTRFVIICSPNNPTGTIAPRDELRTFIGGLPPEVILILDEAYAEYVQSPEYESGLSFFRERPVLVARTFSKVYGLAGLRIGYGAAHAAIVAQMNKIRPPFNTTAPAQAAALAALGEVGYYRRCLDNNRLGREFIGRQLASLGVSFIPTESNFVLVDLGSGAPSVCEKLEARGVIVRPVDNPRFSDRYIRLTFGLPEENELFIGALGSILSDDRAA